MVYICVVDNNFTHSCKIIISNKVIYTALLVISVSPYEVDKIRYNIITYLIENNYNLRGNLYEDTFFYECVDIIIPYLTMSNIVFTVIEPEYRWWCCC